MIKITKHCYRQTATQIRDGGDPRPLMIALEPDCLVLYLKQKRMKFRVPWSQIYTRAAQDAAEANRLKRRTPIRRGLLRSA